MALLSLPHRSPLLKARIETLNLRNNAPWPQQRKTQMRALRLVPHD